MNFTYPDFLNGNQPPNQHQTTQNFQNNPHTQIPNENRSNNATNGFSQIPQINEMDKFKLPPNSNVNIGSGSKQNSKFNDILFNKLSKLDQTESVDPNATSLQGHPSGSPTSTGLGDILLTDNMQLPLTSPLVNPFSPQISPFTNNFNSFNNRFDSFNLPSELQGGVGNISSRRPSYAAESFTRSVDYPFLNQIPGYQQNHPQTQPGNGKNVNLAQYATMNNYNINQLTDGFSNFNLNANLNDFQSRRPSQLVDFDSSLNYSPINLGPGNFASAAGHGHNHNANDHGVGSGNNGIPNHTSLPTSSGVKLENGLILKDQYIVASPDLKNLFAKTNKYFQDVELSQEILAKLKKLITQPKILKLIGFIKNLNNLTFNHKILCLVLNKNGKLDLLSYPNNSNIQIQSNDLVIVDGDRGKDLVMILEPLVDLNFAILFNFLKKIEHLKSLNIADDEKYKSQGNQENLKKFGGTHSTDFNASYIVNSHSNEDNEFIISLPTKQVLRFATPREVHKISGKFLEEKKAFLTCHNKIKELNLQNDLQLINVEYQSDFKKLIFYYFANFKRIDFRGLIKELFKIYKTRIWLCAVLPYDNAESLKDKHTKMPPLNNSIPLEYELNNDQIMKFSINEFANLNSPNYFHLRNLNNLIDLINEQLKGNFYGFNDLSTGTKVPPV